MLRKTSKWRTRTPSLQLSNRRKFSFEALESRVLLAGDLSVSDATAVEGSSEFKFIDAFANLDFPRALAFQDGDLFVASATMDAILRYDGVTGELLGTFVAPGSGGLDAPFDMAFGPDGNLFVSSFTDTPQGIRCYDGNTGTYLNTYVPAGSGGLTRPTGLVFDAAGDLLVSSYDSDQILKYRGPNNASEGNQAGDSLGEFAATGIGSSPDYLAFGPDGNLYVGLPGHATPTPYDAIINRYHGSTGALIDTFVPTGSGGLKDVRGIIFNPDGNLVVADPSQNAVLLYHGPNGTSPGSFINAMVSPGLGNLNIPLGITFGSDESLYVASRESDQVLRYHSAAHAIFTVSLSSANESPVSVTYTTSDGTATAASDYVTASGTLTFAPGQTTRTIVVKTLDDSTAEASETFTVQLSNAVDATITNGQGIATIEDDEAPPTKFYVVNDALQDRTYEYGQTGAAIENYTLNSGNSAPRGAASTIVGDKTWIVDANKKIYVYNNAGALLGSWTAGSLASNATVEGIATNGTDVWIVDARNDRVYRYNGAASRLSGSQNAASSFLLNSGNRNPKDIVADGTHLWVVNDSSTDKVFKYTLSGSLVGSWSISSGGGSPTGITIDPANVSDVWIVDNASDRVYQYTAAASRTSGSHSPASSFALAAGNTNPQGIADPPAVDSQAGTQAAALVGNTASRYRSAELHLRNAATRRVGQADLRMALDFVWSGNEEFGSRRLRKATHTVGAY